MKSNLSRHFLTYFCVSNSLKTAKCPEVRNFLSDNLNFYPDDAKSLPIPITITRQQPLITLVDRILAITRNDDYPANSSKQAKVKEYERQIDRMVYKLYSLTEEEIKIIEVNKKCKR